MSERSVYFRDQANKCRGHAKLMTDPETQDQLRKLTAEYIMRAVVIESEERGRHFPSLIGPQQPPRLSLKFLVWPPQGIERGARQASGRTQPVFQTGP
jgi:hypothetical protein